MTWISFTVWGQLLLSEPLLAITKSPTVPLESTWKQLVSILRAVAPQPSRMENGQVCSLSKSGDAKHYATLSEGRPKRSRQVSCQLSGPSVWGLLIPRTSLSQPCPHPWPLSEHQCPSFQVRRYGLCSHAFWMELL